MLEPWRADVDVTAELASSLVGAQFPELAPVSLAAIGSGWDNAVFLVNDAWVFRFPRRAIAAPLIENEARHLPRIAAQLPLSVPMPQFVGVPALGYPYPFAGYAFLPGTTACSVELARSDRARLAAPLGRFLAALHGIEASADAPRDELGRTDLRSRAELMRARLATLESFPGVNEAIAVLETSAPYAGPRRWVHGDLYVRHLLLSDGRLTGVIDWGDLHVGDPALDVSIAMSFLPVEARGTFEKAYGMVDGAMWARARFRAIHYGVALVHYGRSVGDPTLERAGRDALELGLEGW